MSTDNDPTMPDGDNENDSHLIYCTLDRTTMQERWSATEAEAIAKGHKMACEIDNNDIVILKQLGKIKVVSVYEQNT